MVDPKTFDGRIVQAMTFESIEYDRAPERVVGTLAIRHVATLGYDQYLVDGTPVNPATVKPAPEGEA